LGSHYYYLIIIFYTKRNALKSTYNNVEIQKKFGGNPRIPCLKVSEGGEVTFYAVREKSVQHKGAEGGQGREKRQGMVSKNVEHPPA